MSEEINKGIPAAADAAASDKRVVVTEAAALELAALPEQQPGFATEVADAHVGLDPVKPLGENQAIADADISGKPVVNRFDHLTQAEYLGEDQAETSAGGAAGGMPAPTPADIGPQAPTAVLQHAAPANEEQWRTRPIALVALYEHGMASNSPRTLAELREIKALLDIE